jgi:O-antigen/teichoic acid export membrane protein
MTDEVSRDQQVPPVEELAAAIVPGEPAGGQAEPWQTQLRNGVRNGQSALTMGLLFDGVASYIFLTAAGRALGPDRFAIVSVLWVVLFLVGNGLFIPIEQELSRSIAARRARGLGSRSLVRRVGTASSVLLVVVSIGTLADRSRIADSLFRGDDGFVVALVGGIVGVWLMFMVRGFLSGNHRFHSYALMFVGDALAKAIPAVVLLAVGATNPITFALVMAASAYVGSVVPLVRDRPPPTEESDPPPDWGRLLSSLGFLLLTSFLSALAINIGTIAIEVIGTRVDEDKAGIFLSGLVIARIPLFLFQAIQAIVLPRLSRLAALNDLSGFRQDLRRLVSLMVGATVVAVLGSALLGPLAVKILFGDEFALLGARDMGLLTLASMLMTCALTLNQAQIALHHQRQTGWPWGVATAAFLAVTATNGADLFLRVELGMVAAGAAALVLVSLLLLRELRHPDEHRAVTPAL